MEKGEVSELDVKVIKELIELEKEFPELKDVEFKKSLEVGPLLVIMFSEHSLTKLSSVKRAIAKKLSNVFKKKIRLIESTKDIRRVAEELLAPAQVLGVNTIWLPDGTYEKKVRVERTNRRRLPADPRTLEEILRTISNEPIRIVFE